MLTEKTLQIIKSEVFCKAIYDMCIKYCEKNKKEIFEKIFTKKEIAEFKRCSANTK